MSYYDSLLRELEEDFGVEAIIYGGCLRDQACGKGPIKDIDIAIEATRENEVGVDAYILSLPGDVKTKTNIFGYNFAKDATKSVNVYPQDHTPLNFVFVRMPVPFNVVNVAERCDFGLCQIALSRVDSHASTAWYKDFYNKTFTYTRDPNNKKQLEWSKRRFESFRERYHDYEFRIEREG